MFTKERVLKWLKKGGLLFLFTWLIWLVTGGVASAADYKSVQVVVNVSALYFASAGEVV